VERDQVARQVAQGNGRTAIDANMPSPGTGRAGHVRIADGVSALAWDEARPFQIKVMTMARREAMAIVVTRCLSPLGTGNDETGSFGLGVGEQW
jgi:hypothetical protein